MPTILSRCLIAIVCCVCFALPRVALAEPAPLYFLALSDIHFDPFVTCYRHKAKSCSLIKRLAKAPASQWAALFSEADVDEPRYREDTNYVLLKKNLKEAKLAAAENHVDFVMVLGDTRGHNFRRYYRKYTGDKSHAGFQSFVKKTLTFVNSELSATFADTNVFMVTGNNDTYSRDYQSVPHGDFFRDMGALWSSLIINPRDRAAMRRQFAVAGYYAVDVPKHDSLRLIVLNSVLFSKKSSGKASEKAAQKQLDWLQGQLKEAKKRKQRVFIALHIPPKLDAYATHRWRLFTLQQFWQEKFLVGFDRVITPFHSRIVSIFSGHLHYDWEQSLAIGDDQHVRVMGAPSVSPIFGNDPGFKVYHYDPVNGDIDDFYTYTYPVRGRGTWSIEHVYNLLNKKK